MDRLHCHTILIGVLLSVYLSYCTDQVKPDAQIRNFVMCTLGNRSQEIYMSCGAEAIINVRSVLQGYQEVPQDTPVCLVQPKDECGVSDSELYNELVKKCMGAHDCHVSVQRIFLNPCGKTSDYVQVEYQCVAENNPPQHVIDVCGDILGGESIAREAGHITTPDYPAQYPPDESCMCSLKALKKGTHIKLTVMDMSIYTLDDGDGCVGDWLEYTLPGQMWGGGFRMCDAAKLNKTYIIENNIELHFRADSQFESRGFWVKYEGIDENEDPVRIKVQCTQYHPTVDREEGKCLTSNNTSEMFLDCHKVGVIEVTGVQHWTKNDVDKCPLVTPAAPNCYHPVDNHPIMETCMGQIRCTFPVVSQPISTCKADSNYFEVQYQCVADPEEVNNIVDICGDAFKEGDISIFRKSGFIESPDYPHKYPPNLRCQCRLSATEETSIHLRVLDLELTGKPGAMCKDQDWLEHTTDRLAWNKGNKICDGLNRNQMLDTGSNDIYLNFNSDGTDERRGFWIQYSARKIEENLEVPVKVSCSAWVEDDRLVISDGNSPGVKSMKQDHKPDKNTALIAGLTVVIVLMLLFCIGMVLYKVKDSRKKYPPPQPTTLETPLDKSYNSLKRYATLTDDNKSSDLTHRISGNYLMRHDEYQRTALAANHLNLPASYINPVFEGSPVV